MERKGMVVGLGLVIVLMLTLALAGNKAWNTLEFLSMGDKDNLSRVLETEMGPDEKVIGQYAVQNGSLLLLKNSREEFSIRFYEKKMLGWKLSKEFPWRQARMGGLGVIREDSLKPIFFFYNRIEGSQADRVVLKDISSGKRLETAVTEDIYLFVVEGGPLQGNFDLEFYQDKEKVAVAGLVFGAMGEQSKDLPSL